MPQVRRARHALVVDDDGPQFPAELVGRVLGTGGDGAHPEEAWMRSGYSRSTTGTPAARRAGLLARNAGTGEYGKIRIGFNAGFVTDHLVALVQVLRREHPHLELVIDNSRPTPEILAMLRQDRLDIALVGGPVTGSGLRKRDISTTRLGVLVQEGHPQARSSAVSVRALGNELLVLLESDAGMVVASRGRGRLDAAEVPPPEVTTVADSTTMLAFVGAGVGFGSLSADALTPRRQKLVPLAEGPDVATSLVWRDVDEPPALRTVIRVAQRHLVDQAPVA